MNILEWEEVNERNKDGSLLFPTVLWIVWVCDKNLDRQKNKQTKRKKTKQWKKHMKYQSKKVKKVSF